MFGMRGRTLELSLGFLERFPCAHQLRGDQVHPAQLRRGVELPLQLGDPRRPVFDICCVACPVGSDRPLQQKERKIVAELRLKPLRPPVSTTEARGSTGGLPKRKKWRKSAGFRALSGLRSGERAQSGG
jgi:hypothetical protein